MKSARVWPIARGGQPENLAVEWEAGRWSALLVGALFSTEQPLGVLLITLVRSGSNLTSDCSHNELVSPPRRMIDSSKPRNATRATFGHRAQGLVEFALTLPILLVAVIGALDFGMAFYTKVVLTNSAREGANYMVYNPADVTGTQAAVQAEGANSGVVIGAGDIQVQCLVGGVPDASCPPRSTAVVTVSHDMPLLVDVIFSGPLQLSSEARMLVP